MSTYEVREHKKKILLKKKKILTFTEWSFDDYYTNDYDLMAALVYWFYLWTRKKKDVKLVYDFSEHSSTKASF